MWRTEQNLILAVIKKNVEKGHISAEQTGWLIKELENLQGQLDRQVKHENHLLEELHKRGWPEDLF